jgi:diguanylate cyclase (GGDEF)-like protein
MSVEDELNQLKSELIQKEQSELIMNALFKISELTNDFSLKLDCFYHQLHLIIGQLVNTSNFCIVKYSTETDFLTFVYHKDENTNQEEQRRYQPRRLKDGFTELVIRKKDVVLLNRIEMLEFYEKGITVSPNEMDQYWLGVPLVHEDIIHGAIIIQSYDKKKPYKLADANLLSFVAQHVSSAIKRIEAKSEDENYKIKLKYAANYDNLTKLPNRSYFYDHLNKTISNESKSHSFCLLFIDLDGFKAINDNYGHHYGDLLLKRVSMKLQEIVREIDIVARFAGDEFVILLKNITEGSIAVDIAQRIVEILSEPILLIDKTVSIGASVGILYRHPKYSDAEQMLKDADIAMYKAKKEGKGKWCIYEHSI